MSSESEFETETTTVPHLVASIFHDHEFFEDYFYEDIPEGLVKRQWVWKVDPSNSLAQMDPDTLVWRKHSDFDLVNADGKILRSGSVSGEKSEELVSEFMRHARFFLDASVELITYPAGERPMSQCCVPVLQRGPTNPDGQWGEAWTSHRRTVNGPDGWASRSYNANGELTHQNTSTNSPPFDIDIGKYVND